MGVHHSKVKLSKMTLSDLLKDLGLHDQKIFKVSNEDTVSQLITTLRDNNILGTLVWSKNFDTDFGFVDLLDVIALLHEHSGLIFTQPESFSKNFFQTQVENLPNFSEINPTFLMDGNVSISVAIRKMVLSHLHRVGITNQDKKVHNLITQSTILLFIYRNIDDLHPKPNSSIEELGLVKRHIKHAKMTDITINAYCKLSSMKISALAVVDEKKKLQYELSVESIRYLTTQNYMDLTLEIQEYMKKVKQQVALFVSPKTTLRSLLEIMTANKLHRLWICENDGHVVGVVTLSDVLNVLFTSVLSHDQE